MEGIGIIEQRGAGYSPEKNSRPNRYQDHWVQQVFRTCHIKLILGYFWGKARSQCRSSLAVRSFLVNQVQVSRINYETSALTEGEYEIFTKYGINEKKCSASHAQIPKRQRNDAPAFPLAGDPLSKESSREKTLSEQPQDQEVIVDAPLERLTHERGIFCSHRPSISHSSNDKKNEPRNGVRK
jgi:hypothetical protein